VRSSDPTVPTVLVVGERTPAFGSLVRSLGAAPGAEAAIRAHRDDPPDVVLVDLGPLERSLEAIGRIRAAFPRTRAVLLRPEAGPQMAARAISAGASGAASRTLHPDRLAEVVRRAATGQLVVTDGDLAEVLQILRGEAGTWANGRRLELLSPREVEVLRRLAAGESVGQIAGSLGIAADTVRSHVKAILSKLGVHTKIEAVTLALRHGLARAAR
jgi:two-component system nitrate/nitrite response regulator NarL